MNWITLLLKVTDFTLNYSGLFSTRVMRVGCKRSTEKSRQDLKPIWNGLDCHQQKGDISYFDIKLLSNLSIVTAFMKTPSTKLCWSWLDHGQNILWNTITFTSTDLNEVYNKWRTVLNKMNTIYIPCWDYKYFMQCVTHG